MSRFFRKTGAVAGVFSLVGLAAAAILLWIVFALRRHRWRQQLEHDSATSAALAAAGFHRAPLDDEDDGLGGTGSRFSPSPIEMTHRSSSGYAVPAPPALGNAGSFFPTTQDDPANSDFNPYNGYHYQAPVTQGGYVAVGTSSPPPPPVPAHTRRHSRHGSNGSIIELPNAGHSASHSAGSTEPLLPIHQRSLSVSSAPPSYFASFPAGPPRLPRDPKTLTESQSSGTGTDHQTPTSVYSDNAAADERLDPDMRRKSTPETDQNSSEHELRDDVDYSRPVLSVRGPVPSILILIWTGHLSRSETYQTFDDLRRNKNPLFASSLLGSQSCIYHEVTTFMHFSFH